MECDASEPRGRQTDAAVEGRGQLVGGDAMGMPIIGSFQTFVEQDCQLANRAVRRHPRVHRNVREAYAAGSGGDAQPLEYDGTLDKYIGDCIMAFWNAPHTQPGHALLAVKAALKMQREMEAGLDSATTRDVPKVAFGIGVNTGPAVVGNMGSSLRHDYTIIGDAVNFSSRLCGVAEGGFVIISPSTYELVKDYVIAEEMPPRKFKGKAAESITYNIIGLKDGVDPER